MNDVDFERADFFGSEALVANPYPYFDFLRGQCPVHRESHHDVVMVTGYEEAVATFSDPERFSSCRAASGPFPPFSVPLEGNDVSDAIEAHRDELPMSRYLINRDEPQHHALRALAMRNFTPKRMLEMEPFMRGLADRLIDGFAAQGRCEFITDFAGRFSLLTVCGLLGVPEHDHQMFLDEIPLGPHANRPVGRIGTGTPGDVLGFLHDRFAEYVEDRRAQPRIDILTSIATATYPDGSLPDVLEVARLASFFFAAGTGTTTHLLAFALQLIAERPDLQQLLRDDPELITNFIEETLRMESPIKGTFRVSRVPTTIGEVEVPAGTTLMIVDAAANRDPRKFESPNEFRVDRENARQHLAFGRGIHLCAGANLARAEGRIGIERMLNRLGDIRISDDVHGLPAQRSYEYVASFIFRGLQRLHLEFRVNRP